jgi:hypothetical protein
MIDYLGNSARRNFGAHLKHIIEASALQFFGKPEAALQI